MHDPITKNPFSESASLAVDDPFFTSPHVSTSGRVYGELRSRIISLEMPPGATVARNELADQFNVSQSPVREAILRLEQDGLMISYPQSRTVVTYIDVARVHEEHFLRLAVECEVVRCLAEKPDAETIRKAKGFLKMQAALVDDIEQSVLFKQLDEAFHETLFAGVGQLSLHRHVTARCGNLARVRSIDLPRPEKMSAVLAGHQAVLDAMETGDGDAAARMMREHLSGSMKRLPQIVKDNPDFFSK